MARVSLVFRSPRAPCSRTLTEAKAPATRGVRERTHGMTRAPVHRNALRDSTMAKEERKLRATWGCVTTVFSRDGFAWARPVLPAVLTCLSPVYLQEARVFRGAFSGEMASTLRIN